VEAASSPTLETGQSCPFEVVVPAVSKAYPHPASSQQVRGNVIHRPEEKKYHTGTIEGIAFFGY
jgi:hypothetical protein